MVMRSGEFVRYTFVTDKCSDDLSAVLTCMAANQLLPSNIETVPDEREATKVVVDSAGPTDAHMHLIAAQIDRRPSIRYFGYERLSQDFRAAA
jgi:hypothetical protein